MIIENGDPVCTKAFKNYFKKNIPQTLSVKVWPEFKQEFDNE